MHHWDPAYESDTSIAPSPVIRTYRPYPPSKPKSKRRRSSMSTGGSGSPESTRPRGVSSPKPQARSAGMAERAPRNESLTDLVRFFQTQNAPAAESTTALPIVQSPERPQTPQETLPKEKEVKPLHRRLLHFTQRPKKESTPRTKEEEKARQMAALQREGYLLPVSKAKSSKSSLDRTLSRTSRSSRSSTSSKKQDIEKIGRPWLENKGHSKQSSTDTRSRLASFDLSDFGSLVDVAVSMTEFSEASPSLYPSLTTGGPAARSDLAVQSNQSVNSQPASVPVTSLLDLPHPSLDPSASSTSMVATQGSSSSSDHARRPSGSSNSSIRTIDQNVGANAVKVESQTQSVSVDKPVSTDKSSENVSASAQIPELPRSSSETSTTIALTGAPSQRSLKLFPDVAPPRISSKNAWRLSSVPQYQRPPSYAPSVRSNVSVEAKDLAKPVDGQQPKPEAPTMATKKENETRSSTGGYVSSESLTESTPAAANSSKPVQKFQSKSRPSSLALGTLQAFPLPAPTRPLPSIPQPSRAPPAAPDKSRLSVQVARHKTKGMDLPPGQPSPIAEDPHEPENQDTRPATALGFAGEVDSAIEENDESQLPASIERPHSTSPEQPTARKRASSVRLPKMQESPSPEGNPIADSPVLGQITPVKQRGKRAPRKSLQINSNADRKNLPFGLPSPPPSGALPPDPSTQMTSSRAMAQRNITAPTGAPRSLEASFGTAHHRASMVSRSSSSRSSLRHESIPESYEPSQPESPLPSSDDEGFGPAADTIRPRRQAEKQSKRAHPIRHKYDTVDGRTGHTRPRYDHVVRSQTPQGRTSHEVDQLASPRSINSQSTFRSRDTRNSHFIPQEPNHFLEDRVANLERQNQILQAALLAALNAGVKDSGMEGLQAALSPLSAAPQNSYQRPGRYQQQQYTHGSRPESWVSSSRSSEHSGFETPGSVRDSRANIRQLDNMIEDIEAGWLSDKSNMSAPRVARNH